MMFKRVFDLIFAAVGVVLLAPFLLLVALLVKLDSPGPVFYRGLRTGLHGVPFRILKFRTMVVNAETLGGMSTAAGDPRITRVGRFLRRAKIDELPQLFNILRGEMSFVGPRPEFPEYTSQYTDDEKLILTVRPGITDYASLRFRHLDRALGAHDADRVYEEQVKPVKNSLRVRYVKDRSFLGDLGLIFQTIYRVLLG